MDPAKHLAHPGYCVFDTAIGACGVAWSARGVTHIQLPAANRAATERLLRMRAAGATAETPPSSVALLIASLRQYFAGERVDFSAVTIDLSEDVDPFHRRVYDVARTVDWGHTVTYGDIARGLGQPDAREVGQALSRNPVPIVVPCHRVVGSGNKLGGFSAPGGQATKERLLTLEGVHVGDDAPRLPGL